MDFDIEIVDGIIEISNEYNSTYKIISENLVAFEIFNGGFHYFKERFINLFVIGCSNPITICISNQILINYNKVNKILSEVLKENILKKKEK